MISLFTEINFEDLCGQISTHEVAANLDPIIYVTLSMFCEFTERDTACLIIL